MKAIAFANRLARDIDEKSVIDLTADVRLEILDAINGALQTLHAHAPVNSKTAPGSIALAAPLAISLGVTAGSCDITGYAFTAEQLYDTIRIDGDDIDNRVVGTTRLLHPYNGTTAPSVGLAATLTLNPAGDSNSILYTAATAGAAGNAITVEYAAPAASAETTVVAVGDAVTVTPGTKARMVVTGAMTIDGSNPFIVPTLYRRSDSNGKPSYSDGFDGLTSVILAWNGTKWRLGAFGTFESTENVATPDLVTTWTPVGAATGTPTVTPGISSAAQVVAAVNASASALVTATAVGTVTGAVAAVAAANLTGGTTGTVGATLYGDGTAIAEPYDEMIGDPTILETGRQLIHRKIHPVTWTRKESGEPRFYWIEANSPNQNSPAPSVLRLDRFPDRAYRLQAQFTLAPARITFSDLLAPGAAIPLRAEHVEVYLLPIARGILTSSELWKDPSTKAEARNAAEAAEQKYKIFVPTTIATPRNEVGTPTGF